MALETEVKIYVADLGAVRQQLEHLNAVLVSERTFEHNIRFDDTNQRLIRRGVVLRLRQDGGVRLTYKESAQQHAGGITSRVELETEVGDFDTMYQIFIKLGYMVNMVYDKYRTTYELADTEIVLDEMPYGNFVEIEGDPDAIEHVIKLLGLQSAPRMESSYVWLFERLKRRLGLSFRDLTFENFKGVIVPAEAFRT